MTRNGIAPRPGVTGRRESQESLRVLQIAKRLTATVGAEFLDSLVRHIATSLHADCAYVAELAAADRLRTVASFRDGQNSPGFDLPLAGTAPQQALADGVFACGKDVRAVFPTDAFLEAMAAEGFVGLRLSDSLGQPIGLIGMASSTGFTNIQVVRSVLEIFAPRAAAELERKRRDDIHRENEERYRVFISSNPDAMWRIELEQPVPLELPEEEQVASFCRYGYLAECNGALARLAGVETTDQLTGLRFPEIAARVNPNAMEDLRAAVRTGFRTVTSETTHQDATGREVHRMRIAFGIVEDGSLRRIWATTRDISELRRAEFALAASERRFRELLEHIQLPAVILSATGAVLFANDFFIELAGQSREVVVSSTWLKGIVPNEEAEIWRQNVRRDGDGSRAAVQFEGSVQGPNGHSRTISWNGICLYGRDGAVTALAAIGRDVTRERVLESRIREAAKLEEMGRFAAGMAHDFNTLLSIILTGASQMCMQADPSDPIYTKVAAVEKAAIRCKGLIAQLTAFGYRHYPNPGPVILDEVISSEMDILRMLAGEKVRVLTSLGVPAELIHANRTQIQRVLSNLVTNARDAMPQGGIVMIRTATIVVVAGDVTYPGIRPGTYISLEVADQGVGMTDEVRSRIFEPFFAVREQKETGLGMSIVYGIVVQSGGHIAVRSQPGEGTQFEILLPRKTNATLAWSAAGNDGVHQLPA